METVSGPALSPDWAAFLEGGVSIIASSRTRSLEPAIARAVGCIVADDRDAVTILVPLPQAGVLIGAVRESRTIAVVFSEPSTHRTIQIKGTDAETVQAGTIAHEAARRYLDNFAQELEPLGFPVRFTQALLSYTPTGLLGVRFTPLEAFLQTPGPRAGSPLKTDDRAP